MHVHCISPQGTSSDLTQHSAPKLRFVDGCRHWKLSHSLTCALRPVLYQRLVVLYQSHGSACSVHAMQAHPDIASVLHDTWIIVKIQEQL